MLSHNDSKAIWLHTWPVPPSAPWKRASPATDARCGQEARGPNGCWQPPRRDSADSTCEWGPQPSRPDTRPAPSVNSCSVPTREASRVIR